MTTTMPTPDDKTPSTGMMQETLRKYNVRLPEINQPLGHNRIIELIAEGGMAAVYKVWHEDLEIVRAIKILKPGFDDESKERLRTEAKISAHLHHPNIVEMYGVHFWNDSVPYLEMEYVDGMSLKQLIEREKQIPFPVAVAIIRFVCNALHYAHNQTFTLYGKSYEGIVHRDLKPANILLTREGIPKLADFGIAKPTDISLHTVGQKVMGTFTYLSPEQLNGEPLDRRSDIYSLGIVLYECITGEKAFPQKTLADLIREKLRNQYRRIDSFGIDIPKKLEQIIDKSMQINREKRYADAEEFGNELNDVLAKCTEETPEKILFSHLSGRLAAESQDPENLRRRRRRYLPAVIIGSFFLVFSVIMAVFLAEALKTKHAQSHMTSEAARQSGAARGDTARTDTAQPVSRTQAFAPAPVPASKPVGSDASLDRAQQSRDRQNTVKANQTDLSGAGISAGFAAYRTKRYREAIPLLESSLQKGLNDSLRQMATVCLLESYLSVNNLAGAKRIAETEHVADGYYSLLAGRTFQRLGNLPAALDALNRALSMPSKYKKDLRRDAMFLLARTQEDVYTAKPNSGNKRLALRAWQQFLNEFCSWSDLPGQCREARVSLKNLTE
jgi:serine/threonine protein kinase